MMIRHLFLAAIAIQLAGCMASPRLVSNRVSDYEPPSKEERAQKEKLKDMQLKQEAQPQKVVVVKPKSEDSI